VALTYDLTKIKDRDKISDELLNETIWKTLATGIGEITDENYPIVANRLYVLHTTGVWPTVLGAGTIDDFLWIAETCIGLKTNVFPAWSDAKFWGYIKKSIDKKGEFIAAAKEKAAA
jgi:hypothetical protein